MAVRPAPRRFRLLKKKVSPRPMPSAPLANRRRYSPAGASRHSVSPKSQMVGTKRAMAKRSLKRFRPMGWTVSPLFLNRMTAKAHVIAVTSANPSPT